MVTIKWIKGNAIMQSQSSDWLPFKVHEKQVALGHKGMSGYSLLHITHQPISILPISLPRVWGDEHARPLAPLHLLIPLCLLITLNTWLHSCARSCPLAPFYPLVPLFPVLPIYTLAPICPLAPVHVRLLTCALLVPLHHHPPTILVDSQ